MKGFNLAKFKKVKEDKDWADLVHEDGHSIRIAKGPLSHLQRRQLEALEMHQFADGGLVPQEDMPEINASSAPQVASFDPNSLSQPPVSAVADPASQDLNRKPADVPVPQAETGGAGELLRAKNPGLEQEQESNTRLAEAKANAAQQEAASIEATQQKIAQLPTQAQIVQGNKAKEDALYQAYADKKLDPEKFWEGHSKTAAAVGLLFSSLGQALGQGQIGNGGLDAIHHGIQQEVDRQKNDQDQAHNLWKMNREALGDDLSANLATQNQLWTGLQFDIKKHAAALGGPVAIEEGKIKNAQIQQIKDYNNAQFALTNPTAEDADPATRVPILAQLPGKKELAPKALEEIKQAQVTAQKIPELIDNFFLAAQDTQGTVGGLRSLSPFEDIRTPGQHGLSEAIAPTIADITGTVKQAEFEAAKHNLVPNKLDKWEENGGLPTKLNSLINYAATKSSAATNSKALGLNLQKFPSTNITREAIVNYIKQKYPDYTKYVENTGNSTLSRIPATEKPKVKYQIRNGKEIAYHLNPKTGDYE